MYDEINYIKIVEKTNTNLIWIYKYVNIEPEIKYY